MEMCSKIGRLEIVNKSVPWKVVYRFNDNPTGSFYKHWQTGSKIYIKSKEAGEIKIILKKTSNTGGLSYLIVRLNVGLWRQLSG